MYFYRAYHWTRDIIDNLEIEYLCDIMIVADKIDNAQELTDIEDVFFK